MMFNASCIVQGAVEFNNSAVISVVTDALRRTPWSLCGGAVSRDFRVNLGCGQCANFALNAAFFNALRAVQ